MLYQNLLISTIFTVYIGNKIYGFISKLKRRKFGVYCFLISFFLLFLTSSANDDNYKETINTISKALFILTRTNYLCPLAYKIVPKKMLTDFKLEEKQKQRPQNDKKNSNMNNIKIKNVL